MKASRLYRIEVAPLVILPLDRSPLFTYASEQPIKKGSLVAIPFGSREIEGIVYNSQPLPGPQPRWMKRISAVKIPAYLTDEQRELGLFVSQEYLTPLGKTLKHFTPKPVKMRPARKKEAITLSPLRKQKGEEAVLKAFDKLPAGTAGFLDTSLVASPKHMLLLLAKRLATKDGQALILVPEITLLAEWEQEARRYFPEENIAVLHSQMANGPYFHAWEKVRSGEAKIILATRQGLFAPFQKLKLVIMTEEQDESYKQWDMSPRYHAKRIAKGLAVSVKAGFLYATPTPSADLVLSLRERSTVSLLPEKEQPPLGASLTLINLKLERFRKNYSPLSEELVANLRATLAAGKQSLLYIHRQGMSSFSLCESCKNIFRCPESGHPLTDTREGYYRCLGCPYKTALFPSCFSCGGLQFHHVGFGTERIEKEVCRLFPGAKVFRADSSTMRKAGMLEKLSREAASGEIDILIGTQMILKSPPLPSLGLVAMIDADTLLSWPDFQADERFYQYLKQAVLRVRCEGDGQGRVLVQTFQTESAFFQRANAREEKAFYEHMLEEREALFYPPFSRFIALSCQHKSEEELRKNIQALYETLEKIAGNEPGLKLGLPEEPRALKRQRLFESSLLLRIPRHESLSPQLLAALTRSAKACTIDIDPLSFN